MIVDLIQLKKKPAIYKVDSKVNLDQNAVHYYTLNLKDNLY